MKFTVFAKKRTNKDGAPFFTYLSTVMRKSDGEVLTVQLKFREQCGAPDPHKCPRIISVPKGASNLVEKKIPMEDGEKIARTIWISQWEDFGDYVDTSMDDIFDEDE